MNKNFWNKVIFIIKGRKVKLPTVKAPSVKAPKMANVDTPKIGNINLPKFAGFNLKGKTSAIIFGSILASTALLSLAIYFSIAGQRAKFGYKFITFFKCSRSKYFKIQHS